MEDRDSETGRIAQRYSDKAFIEAVDEHEPASTREVAEQVGCTRRNADVRLRALESEEQVKHKMAGKSLIWMIKR
jgi:predicted transcriptional regulator